MSELRTRIAAAAVNAHYSDGDAWPLAAPHDRQYWLGVADAVISELGLRQERRRFDTLFGNRNEPQHRYVTDWMELQ